MKKSEKPPSEEVCILAGQEWLETVMRVHIAVRATLPVGQQRFVVSREKKYFADLLSGRGGALLGMIIDERLAGFLAMVFADNYSSAISAKFVTYPGEKKVLAARYGDGGVCVIQSMCVLKEWSGNGYSRELLCKAIAYASFQKKCKNLFAQVASQNAQSMDRFLEAGFHPVASWNVDHWRFLLHRTGFEDPVPTKRQR